MQENIKCKFSATTSFCKQGTTINKQLLYTKTLTNKETDPPPKKKKKNKLKLKRGKIKERKND